MSAPRLEPRLIQTEIARNRRKTVLVVGMMFALLWAVVFAAGWVWGQPPLVTAVLAVVLGGVYLLITYNASTKAVIRASGARPVNMKDREEKLLAYKVEEMAIAAGIPVPKVYVQDSKDPNAFAAGRHPKEAVVCVTTGGLQMWDNEELEGVIAHETAHIVNRDILLQTVTVGVIGTIALLSEIVVRSLWFGAGRRGGGRKGEAGGVLIVVGLVLLILAPILSRLTYFAISRNREYLADSTGVRLTRNPEGLARALEKIQRDPPDDPKGSRTVASLYIANPWVRRHRNNVWSTHPPLEERIRRLRALR